MCPKVFASIEGLNRHAVVHKNPQKCPECGKTFRTTTGLKGHMITSSSGTQEYGMQRASNFSLKSNLMKYIKKYYKD